VTASLTQAQRHALDWLPADGAWRTKLASNALAIHALRLGHPGIVEQESGRFGPRKGRMWRYRLTAVGVALRAQVLT
jgi:hypothetical protein